MPILAKDLIDFMLESRGSLMNTKTVRELLFDGYQDPILDLVKALNATDFPAIPFDNFGW
jgi:scavenger receptor class B, member 1